MTGNRTVERPGAAGPGDAAMARAIWPLLAAGALGLVPFTIFSNFLVDISRVAGQDPATVGAMRGLGGVAALIVGIGCAPLIDALSRRRIAAGSVIVLGVACLAAALGPLWSWILFCLLVGAATATLNPAISAMAADAFDDEATAGRAATMVSATMTLTAMLAAPLLAGPALIWGWRGDLVATAVLCAAMAALLHRRAEGAAGPADVGDPTRGAAGYAAALRDAMRIPGAMPLLAVSLARTAAFMGQLAYVAVLYDDRFGLGPGVFSLVWTLSGFSFFLGNWFGGRVLRRYDRILPILVIAVAGTVVATAAILVLFTTTHLPVALGMTALLGLSHAVIAACVTTGLVRGAAGRRGTVLALNGAGQSIGVFAGASIGGLGLRWAGWTGTGFALGAATLAAVACAAVAVLVMRGLPGEDA